mmetsp:Transcript_85104/g.268439  ORF Transcript_85104/g.268439 Transcript_85104/m.268439 type:complete len:212 (+) Transcript_85104:52-687(+)
MQAPAARTQNRPSKARPHKTPPSIRARRRSRKTPTGHPSPSMHLCHRSKKFPAVPRQRLSPRVPQVSAAAQGGGHWARPVGRPSGVDHDVGRGGHGAAAGLAVRLARLGPAALGLAAADLPDAAEREERRAEEEPGPAEEDVPVVLQEAEAHGEEAEGPGGHDDDRAEEDAGEAPLALADHGADARTLEQMLAARARVKLPRARRTWAKMA